MEIILWGSGTWMALSSFFSVTPPPPPVFLGEVALPAFSKKAATFSPAFPNFPALARPKIVWDKSNSF